MKKFFSVMFLIAAIIFVVVPSNSAEARDVYIGSYSEQAAVLTLAQLKLVAEVDSLTLIMKFTEAVRAGVMKIPKAIVDKFTTVARQQPQNFVIISDEIFDTMF